MKLFKIALLALVVGLASCYDDYVHDYETTSAGFAIQKPLRTVISDRDMPIYVGVALGGKREVDMDDWATFTIDAALLEGTGLELLPADYYQLGDPGTFRVRKPNLPVADVEIRFTEAFYADAKASKTHYALPFRLTGSSMDEIRAGAETSVVAIKYASSFSGTYYLQGEVSGIGADGRVIEGTTVVYKEKDLIKNLTRDLATLSPSELLRPGLANLAGSPVNRIKLTIGNDGAYGGDYDVTVGTAQGGATVIEGSGTYIFNGGYTFNGGDTPCPEINLKYIYELDGKRYKVSEQLVLRRDPLDDLRVETW